MENKTSTDETDEGVKLPLRQHVRLNNKINNLYDKFTPVSIETAYSKHVKQQIKATVQKSGIKLAYAYNLEV